jgi:riboflavin biosynthesis pyrimidine reductase
VLVGADVPLGDLYAPPPGPWLRVNMVSSVDGAAHGADGRSGSVNNAIDAEVFHLLRSQADAIIVGAGTARVEGYHPAVRPLVVVSGRGRLPETLEGADGVRVEAGGDEDALTDLVRRLRAEGFEHLLCEGGPTLLGRLLSAGLVDELCCTITPLLVGGDAKRIVDGPPVDVPLTLSSLVEQDGTLLARWLVSRG